MPADGMYWVPVSGDGKLAIMPRPRAGDWLGDEISRWRAAGITTVVSLLEVEEASELALREEAELCRQAGIAFISYPIADRGVPADETSLRQLVTGLAKSIEDGKCVAIHCRAGIGRSALVAACVMAIHGVAAATALSLLSAARGLNVPDTDEQRNWINTFYEKLAEHGAAYPTD
jgi:protein-tyrosine phosphatase